MNRPDDIRSKAMYHARMFALALLGALTIFLALQYRHAVVMRTDTARK